MWEQFRVGGDNNPTLCGNNLGWVVTIILHYVGTIQALKLTGECADVLSKPN